MASTVTATVTTTATASSASASSTAVPNQAGVLTGENPVKYNASDPIVLFIIQAIIIIAICRALHWPLSRLRQPRVIAEVIGGVLLGPSVCGRIPGFTKSIFPTESMAVLTMAANLGLVLFLFLVGLEVDMRLLLKNWRVAASVSAAGMVLPFGLGAGIAYGLYHQFRIDAPDMKHVSFGVYLLFIGVAMAITAFPVLARILTELKLLSTNVGTIVLSAGVGNDVVGWILLALTVALVNAGTGLTALYVLLVAIGYVLLLVYVVRPAFIWLLRRNGSLENGPSQSMVALTVAMVLASAFFTDIIGIHPIFGGFLVGVICPHEGGFAMKTTEKIEDLVSVLLLPLYFALSGLRTNLALLDNGITWAYVIGVITVAFFGKITGGTLAAKVTGLVWRESFTVGVLMSCKGLVELIVLNIGLQAGILSTRVFTIFVVMALITTFATTPLVTYLYPVWYQQKMAAWRRGEISWDGKNSDDGASGADTIAKEKQLSTKMSKITVYLRLDNLPGIFSFINVMGGQHESGPRVHRTKRRIDPIAEETEKPLRRPVEVHGVRLVELSQRTSTVMQVSEREEMQERDPVINVFRAFGKIHNVAISAEISIAPEDCFAEQLVSDATTQSSDLLLIPWSESGVIAESQHDLQNPAENRFVSQQHNHFISKILTSASCTTAIMVDRGFGGNAERGLRRGTSQRTLRSQNESLPITPVLDPCHHIFMPFFGGVDDRVALRFVLQLAENTNITATIAYIAYSPSGVTAPGIEQRCPTIRRDLPRRLSQSQAPSSEGETEEIQQLEKAAASTPSTIHDSDATFFQTMSDSLPEKIADRVVFEKIVTQQPLQYMIAKAREEVGLSPRNGGDLIVLGRSTGSGNRSELKGVLESLGFPSGAGAETRKCLGDAAEAAIVSNVKASIMVVQAGGRCLERESSSTETYAKTGLIGEKIESL